MLLHIWHVPEKSSQVQRHEGLFPRPPSFAPEDLRFSLLIPLGALSHQVPRPEQSLCLGGKQVCVCEWEL